MKNKYYLSFEFGIYKGNPFKLFCLSLFDKIDGYPTSWTLITIFGLQFGKLVIGFNLNKERI